MAVALGLALALLGCTSFYLAAPRQNWLARPWPAWPAGSAGALLIAAALSMLCRELQALAAVFVVLTWAMLLLAAMPYLGALLFIRRSRRHADAASTPPQA